jgi:hypothetical protein
MVAAGRSSKSPDQRKQVKARGQLQEQTLGHAHDDTLAGPGAQVILEFQNHRPAPQQSAENPGAAALAGVAGRAAAAVAQANRDPTSGSRCNPSLLFEHPCRSARRGLSG